MAEGFLQSNEVYNRSFEDIRNDYFEFLVWNSFFQDIQKDELGVILRCKMHDLVHDLAMSVVDRNEFGIGKEEFSQVRRLQLVCDKGSSITTTEVLLSKAKNLRTIVALDPKNHSQVNNLLSAKHLRVLHPLGGWHAKFSFSNLKSKYLRLLDLSNCEFDLAHDVSLSHSHNLQTLILRSCSNVSREFEALTENIGMLKQLGYLDVSGSAITRIPDSITCISNLMTLSFRICGSLDALPTELGALTRLSCLDLSYTDIKVLPESCISNLCNLEIVNFGNHHCKLPNEIKNWPKLKQFSQFRYGDTMPKGVEKLTCLEILEWYMVREEADIQARRSGHSGIEELAVLDSLQVLRVRNLENVRGGIEDAKRAKLKDKQNLRELYLYWICDGFDEDDHMVLEGLQPHPNLRMLEIHGFSGLNLPKWMCRSSSNCLLPNMVSLNLWNCRSCVKLPPLGMLPCLRDLWIWRMYSVKHLGTEFYYQPEERQEEDNSIQNSTTTAISSVFPSLVKLSISNMENLEEWVAHPSSHSFVDSFPLLEKLNMKDCPNLRIAPNSFPSLKELKLWQTNGKAVNSIFGGGGCLTSLTSIDISESPELIYFSLGALFQENTPNLRSLKISNCTEFEGFRENDDPNNNDSSLHKLELWWCPVLTALPDLRLWTSLRV
ncbi:putative disease resistance protein RGA1 [Papaver somniferum]|uniref:putative disease resistance protein RGA1 n=1 Tax=Papaver somniferum TaxID=3469 RepID=UPI000E705935|nr:putative disease resistance protein RGA1 [Papaver somniferum]